LTPPTTLSLTYVRESGIQTLNHLTYVDRLFEFVFKGLDALGYEEHLDYDIAVAREIKEESANVKS